MTKHFSLLNILQICKLYIELIPHICKVIVKPTQKNNSFLKLKKREKQQGLTHACDLFIKAESSTPPPCLTLGRIEKITLLTNKQLCVGPANLWTNVCWN
jgi:hypothetical protein